MTRRTRMIKQLAQGDKVFAIGWVYLKLTNYWKLFYDTGFLVRTSGGSYYLLADGVIEKTGVRAVFQRPVNVTQYRMIVHAVRLMTDSGEIYFFPVDINPIG